MSMVKALARKKFPTHNRISIDFDPEEGRTQQQFADECDIDNILQKFRRTHVLTHTSRHAAEYGFADSTTLHEAMNIVAKANSMFADLPSHLREKFDGDPGKYLDFVQDPVNKAEMADLGLLADDYQPPPKTPPASSEDATEAKKTETVEPISSKEK